MSWKALLGVCVSVAMVGCASTVPLQRTQVDALSRDAAPTEVERLLGKATAYAQHEVRAGDKAYLARHFLLQTGGRQEMTVVCTPNCLPIMITVPVTSEYVLIQTVPERALLAWGTLEELSKDADPLVSGLMPAIKAKLQASKEQKK